MLKRLPKKTISVVLTLCMIFSMITVGAVSGSAKKADLAATGNPIAEKAIDQLIEDGMRIACIGLDAIGEATGEEGVEEAFSIIESWCLMSAEEVAIEELKELCQEILDEIKAVEQEIKDDDTVITQMIANDAIRNARSALDTEWKRAVTGQIENENATEALNAYLTFMKDALDEKSDDVLNADIEKLLKKYALMATTVIDTGDYTTEGLKKKLFETNDINTHFLNLITNLASGLKPEGTAATSCAEYAAQYAYLCYPFSHQQYKYVHAVIEQQILTLILVGMVYNEYLFQQGEYLKETYGKDSNQYRGYLEYQKDFYEKLTVDNNSVCAKISKLLESRMNVDGSGEVNLLLSDYMKPEDAVSTTLTISGYENSIDVLREWCNYYDYDYDFYYDDDNDSVMSNAEYIQKTVKFNKVMTHTPAGNNVYYILDPEQYSGTDALYIKNLDHKINIKGGGDVHTESCDYRNLCKEMSDGVNTFVGISDKDCTGYDELLKTNYFSLRDSTLQNYLTFPIYTDVSGTAIPMETRKYLPDSATFPSSGKNYVLTAKYDPETKVFGTIYYTFILVDSDEKFPDKSLQANKELYMENYQSSKDLAYTAILRNTGSTFNERVHAEVSHPSNGDIKITADNVHYYQNGDSFTAAPGTKLTIRMKATNGKMTALKMRRNTAASTDTPQYTDTVLLDEHQISRRDVDSEGYVTVTTTVPYSDVTYRLEIDPEYCYAKLATTGSGTAVFDDGSTAEYVKIGNSKTFYATPGEGYAIHSVYLEDKKGQMLNDCPVTLDASKKRAPGEDAYTFTMPNQDVTVKTNFVTGNTVSFDTEGFITDDDGKRISYLYFVDDPAVDSRCVAPGFRVSFKAVTDRNYEDPVITAKGVTSGNDYEIAYKDGVYSIDTATEDVVITATFKEHHFVNGFCTDCGFYQTPQQDEDGWYQIENGGNLFWISALTRDDHTHAQFEKADRAPKFELTKDIDLESRQWEPIASSLAEQEFTGEFDGNGFTINNFYIGKNITEADFANDHSLILKYGLFLSCDNAVIRNFSIKGKAEITSDLPDGFSDDNYAEIHYGTISGATCHDTEFSDIFSYVDVTFDVDNYYVYPMVCGIAIEADLASNIRRCVNFGNITGGLYVAAGIANLEFYPMGVIEDCANIGKITSTWNDPFDEGSNAMLSGILCYPWVSIVFEGATHIDINNCYNYGELTSATEDDSITPIVMLVSNDVSVNNCYRLDTASTDQENCTPQTAEQFKSGEVGYKLNSGVTDGTQAWYQNIDNGKTPDDYPLPDKSRGTIYYIESENRYSNYPDGNPPTPTEAPTDEPTQAPTDAPTEAPTEAPTDAPTEPPTEAPTDPEPAEHGIRNYDELVAFANSVNSGNNSANNYLENNILVPADAADWTAGIGTEDNPYTGDFNGNGYCIIGLKTTNPKYSAPFGCIGKGGKVHDLMVFGTTCVNTSAEKVGGIAAVNEGIIDHCTSGINVLGKKMITLPSGKKINPADYNSVLYGTNCGGIAALNKGTITGCRNGAIIDGAACGGIAVTNEGTIYGCTNNGSVGSKNKSCKEAGGLAAENSGTIKSSYNSGKINCYDTDNMGTVAAKNSSEDVNDVFYSDYNDVPSLGKDPDVKLNSSCKLVSNTDMQKSSFVKTLNEVTEVLVTWMQAKYNNTMLNQGFPLIKGKFLEQQQKKLANGITMSGLMHQSLNVTAQEMDAESEEYQAIDSATSGDVLSAYSVSTTDANGNYVPAELWTAGGVQISISLGHNSDLAPTGAGIASDIALTITGDDGELRIIYPDSVENGAAIFTLAAPTDFALIRTAPVLYGDTDLDGDVSILDATLIQRFLAGLDTLTVEQKLAADVDGDGDVTIIDATLIQRWLAGIIKKFPVEEETE